MMQPNARAMTPVRRHRRRGTTAVLAMLYMLIFSALALGFYSSVTMATQIAQNEARANRAQVAAESGLQYLRHELSRIKFPSNTPPERIIQEVFNDLAAQTVGAPNLKDHPVTIVGDTVFYPGGVDNFYIPLDEEGGSFRATLRDMGSAMHDGRTVRVFKVRVLGRHHGSEIARAIEMDFMGDFKTLNIFDFGVGTRGPINISGTGGVFGPVSLEGSLLTTSTLPTPVSVGGSATVAGDLYLTNKNGGVSLSNGCSVGGTSGPDKYSHVHKGVDEPEFPTVDSAPFLQYATNTYRPGLSVYRNTLVPAHTNPSFSGDTTIEGVMYVKHPNRLRFVSKATIRGIIIAENGAVPGNSNTIDFGGGIEAFGADTLPDTAEFPPSMRKLKGSVLLAPGFLVTLRGSSGTIGGTMLADGFDLSGGSGGVVHGNMIGVGLSGFTIGGGGSVQRTRSEEIPAGVVMTFTLKPRPETYLEVRAAADTDASLLPTIVTAPPTAADKTHAAAWPHGKAAKFDSAKSGQWSTSATP